MRLSALTAAFLVAGGIGCSDSHTGSSTVGPTSTVGDNSDGGVVDGGGGGAGGGGDMGGGGGGGGGGGVQSGSGSGTNFWIR